MCACDGDGARDFSGVLMDGYAGRAGSWEAWSPYGRERGGEGERERERAREGEGEGQRGRERHREREREREGGRDRER